MRITRESLSEDTQVLWDDVYEAEFHFIDAKRALRAAIIEEHDLTTFATGGEIVVLNWTSSKDVTVYIGYSNTKDWQQLWRLTKDAITLARFIVSDRIRVWQQYRK